MNFLPLIDEEAHAEAVAARWQLIDAGRLTHRVEAINRKAIPLKAQHQKRLNEVLNSPRTVLAKIEALWQCADEIGAIARPHVACRKGCSHCCHTSVLIATQEAELIGRRIGVKPCKVSGITRGNEIESGYHNPCPFLREDKCTIYEHRPLACRQQFNVDIDPLLCELIGEPASKVPYLNMMDYQKALVMMTTERRESVERDPVTGHMVPCTTMTAPDVGDIREFFPRGKP